MDRSNRKGTLTLLTILICIGLGVLARSDLSHMSNDMRVYNLRWYNHFDNGVLAALGENFTNYTPPYTYLLALAYTAFQFLPNLTAIKIISLAADFINSYLVFKIVRLKYPKNAVPYLAAAAFLCLPTVFVNSAVWGQVDAVYTVFLLVSLYSFLKEKPFWGMLAFSVSFAFKLQAFFLFPFIAILILKNKIKVWYLVLIPVVYVILCLPTVLLGRDWIDVLTIYLNQSETYEWLSGGAPNLYSFISNEYYKPGVVIGLIATLILITACIITTARNKRTLTRNGFVFMALLSVVLLPFMLPKMHDRYFYPADVFSFLAAFFLPDIWFVPLAYQLISGLSYAVFLWDAPVALVRVGAGVNMIIVSFLLWMQFRRNTEDLADDRIYQQGDDE